MPGTTVYCPGCQKLAPILKRAVGVYCKSGSSFERKLPVGRPLCPACFAEQGLTDFVRLEPLPERRFVEEG